MVSKEEIVETVWSGRFVSDSAVSSRIKSARRALGDDGKEQRFIRTLHGQGFRFLADVRTIVPPRLAPPTEHRVGGRAAPSPPSSPRPSIAIFPFRLIGAADLHPAIGDALAHDLITALARLRWLFVIARGSTFRFRSDDLDLGRAGQMLNVSYALSGLIETFASTVTITAELTDTRTGGSSLGRPASRAGSTTFMRCALASPCKPHRGSRNPDPPE